MLGGLLLSALTLLQASLCDAGGGEQARVVTARAGDTVWLDAQLPTESVTTARWKYRGKDVSGFEGCFPVQEDPKFLHFNGRAQMDNISLNLLVRNVTPEDAGNFSFISALNSSQRKTVFITLRVYEPIATPSVLVVNSSWRAANGTCAVLLRCSTSPDRDVAYNWTIGKETYVGATVNYAANYTLQPEEEEPTAWCTASNPVSLGSASTPVTCSNSSHSIQKESATEVLYIAVATVIGVLTFIVAGLGIAFGLRRRAARLVQSTVYAAISGNRTPNTETNAGSIYETVDDRFPSVSIRANTVYDKIQFNRMTKTSKPPSQEPLRSLEE